jgi:amicyanin
MIDVARLPINTKTTAKPGQKRWRLAALGTASAIALSACGAGAAGSASTTATTATTAKTATTAATAPAGRIASVSPGPGPATTAVPAPAPTAASAVSIINFKFTPAALSIKVGTTVVWTNKDAIGHTVNFMTGGINSNVLNQNDQFTHTFTTPGTYGYICSIHPFMHGSVTVTP